MITRWHQLDRTSRIVVDWTDATQARRTVYTIEHELEGTYLDHVEGEPLDADDLCDVTAEVRELESYQGSGGTCSMPDRYSGVLFNEEAA